MNATQVKAAVRSRDGNCCVDCGMSDLWESRYRFHGDDESPRTMVVGRPPGGGFSKGSSAMPGFFNSTLAFQFAIAYTFGMKYLTTADVAKELGVSVRRVQALIKAGRLKAELIGRDWMIKPAALESVRVRTSGRPKKNSGKNRIAS